MFSPEAHKLRARWKDIDVLKLDFTKSPFGLTEEGMPDFRGLLIEGTAKEPIVIEKIRFDKCDLSYCRFIHCRILNGLFASCNMTMADFHTCNAEFTSPGSIRDEWVWYQKCDPLDDIEHSLFSELPEGPGKQQMQLTRLDRFSLSDFDHPSIVFYCDNHSIPCVSSLYRLVDLLNGCSNPPNIFVLNATDYVKCSKEEKQLLEEIFPFGLNGLGETSWFNKRTLVANSALSTTCIVDEIATGLKKLGFETDSNQEIANQKRNETDFWKFVQSALPTSTTYKIESHVTSFRNALMAISEELFHQYRSLLEQFSSQLDSWDYSDAACCIEWCSDNSYTDFSTSIILRDRFYEFLSKPEEALLKIENPKSLFKEGLNYVFYEVHDEKQYSDIVEYKGIGNKYRRAPGGVQSSETLKGLRRKYPQLYEKYRTRKNLLTQLKNKQARS